MAKQLSDLRRALDRAGGKISEDHLIRFDWRVFLLTAVLVVLFLFSVALKLHGSSIAYWDTVYPASRADKSGLIAGEPKSIRSDEWLVGTPWMLSQDRLGYPLHNPNIGAHNDPLLNNMPVGHFTNLFKPQDWGFFVLETERGFSFWWQFKIFGLSLGFFLLLMLLTRNNFLLSVTGSLWVLFSGFTQWWFSTMVVEMLVSFAFLFIGLCYLFLARKRAMAIAGGLLLAVHGLNFVFFFYPPFQVPLAWLIIFMAAGFLFTGERWRIFRSLIKTRTVAAAVIGAGMAVVLFFFYQDAKETINAILNTEYPGRRVNRGGDTGLARMFSGFTLAPTGELEYPGIWANASETSNFILLFPVVMLAWARNYVMRIRNNPVVSALLLYLLGISAWVLVPWPHSLARLSLLSYVSFNRVILGLGVASILVTVIWLAGDDKKETDRRFAAGGSLLIFFMLSLYGLYYSDAIDESFRLRYVLLMVLFFTLLSWLLLNRRRAAFSVLILVALFPYYMVNPVMRGLDPLLKNDISLAAAQVEQQQPGEQWVAYGNSALAALLKATGMNVVNGVTYTPNLDFYSRLDPGGQNSAIYNRYSHSTFREPEVGPVTVNSGAVAGDGDSGNGAGGTSVEGARFTIIAGDSYFVDISPCSPLLEEAGIDHFAFNSPPTAVAMQCLEPIETVGETGIGFYRRTN